MKKQLLLTSLWLTFTCGAGAGTIVVGQFGDDGWYSDDTRDSNAVNLVGLNYTHYGKPGQTPTAEDDTAIAGQIQFPHAAPGGRAALMMTKSGPSASKCSLSKVNESGFAVSAGGASWADDFSMEYAFYTTSTAELPIPKLGVRSTLWGTNSGQSQSGFTAIRSGEPAWDLVLVDWRGTDGTWTKGAWSSSTADTNTVCWKVYRQAGNTFFATPPASTLSLAQLAALNDTNNPAHVACTNSGTLYSWSQVLFGDGAKVANIQIGVGSSASASTGYIDYLKINILNGEEAVDFGSTTLYVDDANGNDLTGDGSQANPFKTITNGIGKAYPGDSIIVEPGTYNESFNLNKSVSLRGIGGRDVTTIVLQTRPTYLGSITISASDVLVEGFTIVGYDAVGNGLASTDIFLNQNITNVEIAHNRIKVGKIGSGSNLDDGFGLMTTYNTDIPARTDDLYVHDNLFEPVSTAGAGAFYVNAGVDSFTFSNNVINGEFTRTATAQALNGLVENNTVIGTGTSAGLGTWGYPDASVWGHTLFQGNVITNTARAITLYDSEGVVILNNTLEGNGYGVYVTDTGYIEYSPANGVGIFSNSVAGSLTAGIANTTTGLLAAAYNWWGSGRGPTTPVNPDGDGVSVSDYVAFSPWLSYGTDTSADPGFQPDMTPLVAFVDDNYVGKANGTLVKFPDGGTGLDHGIGYDAFDTIQAALNAVGAGGTVFVAAGTYVEQVEITNDITVIGSGSGTVIKSPAILTRFYTTSAVNKPIVFVHDTANVVLRDFVVDGDGQGNANYRFQGVSYYRAGGLITNLTVKGVRDTPISGMQSGSAIYCYSDVSPVRNLEVVGCNAFDFQKNGITMNGAYLVANVHGNQVAGAGAVNFIAQNGIQFGFGASGLIQSNQVAGFNYTPTSDEACGILIYQSGATITANIVSACELGVGLVAPSVAMGVIANNSLAGNEWGVSNDSTTLLNASGNWWGSATGPTTVANPGGDGSPVSDYVDFSPWLGDGTDTSPAPGFQPNLTPAYYTPVSLSFSTQPGGAAVGSLLSPQPVVQVIDENNGVAQQFQGAVTLAIDNNPGGGNLNGNMNQNAVNGVVTFTNLSIDAIGTNYTLVASAPGLTSATSSPFTIIPAEANPPLVNITSPVAGDKDTNTITLTGTAVDDTRMDQVWVKLNDGPFQSATVTHSTPGAVTWTINLTLAAGNNLVQVRAVDLSGNESTTSRSFFSVVRSLFALGTTGSGGVNPISRPHGSPTNGAWLEIDRSYTVLGVPANNHLFYNWTRVSEGVTSVVSSAAQYTFTMQSNLMLVANFITNRFYDAAGAYIGLLSEPTGVAHHSSGFFKLKVNTKGRLTGLFWAGGQSFPLKGICNADGSCIATPVRRQQQGVLTAHLFVNLTGGDSITGTVSHVSGWVADLVGDRAVWKLPDRPATNFSGNYTMIIPGHTNAAEAPGGDGYGLILVRPNGRIVYNGYGAEQGPRIRVRPLVPYPAPAVSKDGNWPFYATLYPSYKTDPLSGISRVVYEGSILGWLCFTNGSLEGTLYWSNPRSDGSLYVNGFTNEIPILASPYSAPATGERALALTNGMVVFKDGNLTAPFTNHLTWDAKNNVKVTPPNLNTQSIGVVESKGLIWGTFNHPDLGNEVVIFRGALLQNQNVARGFFLGTNQSGSFLLQGN